MVRSGELVIDEERVDHGIEDTLQNEAKKAKLAEGKFQNDEITEYGHVARLRRPTRKKSEDARGQLTKKAFLSTRASRNRSNNKIPEASNTWKRKPQCAREPRPGSRKRISTEASESKTKMLKVGVPFLQCVAWLRNLELATEKL